MQEDNIIFGGEDKLYKSILEAHEEFPEARGVFVHSTCAIGLIGDDLSGVCKRAEDETGIRVIPFNCEGFRGCSQSLGHHIAIMPLFERMGIRILCTFTGNASVDEIAQAHRAKLNLMHCQRSTPYICKLMEEKYGIPVVKATLFGVEQTSKALRDVAAFFELEDKAEEIIKEEVAQIAPKIEEYRSKFEGKRVFIYQGAPRAWHWINMFREFGVETIAAATTFGHEDDYAKICERVNDGALVIDNPNSLELEEILTDLKPDLFISGLKEKYLAYKLGVPFINGHAYEKGPYAAYSGLLNFARDVEKTLFAPVWGLIRRGKDA
jgi:nitrogenase molybdenum-iron protein alpha chain